MLQYFKICSVVSIEVDKIQLEMNKWPATIMAHGCNTNVFTGNKILECFGLTSCNIRCVAKAADGSLKRLTNSKTINVSEISEFVPPFCHFQQSGKSTSLLNEAR